MYIPYLPPCRGVTHTCINIYTIYWPLNKDDKTVVADRAFSSFMLFVIWCVCVCVCVSTSHQCYTLCTTTLCRNCPHVGGRSQRWDQPHPITACGARLLGNKSRKRSKHGSSIWMEYRWGCLIHLFVCVFVCLHHMCLSLLFVCLFVCLGFLFVCFTVSYRMTLLISQQDNTKHQKKQKKKQDISRLCWSLCMCEFLMSLYV